MNNEKILDAGCWVLDKRHSHTASSSSIQHPASSIGFNSTKDKVLNKRHRSTQGSILIIVMVVCIGLVTVALYFGHSTAMTYRGSSSDLSGRQAQRAIDGAAQYAEDLMIVSGTANSGTSSAAATSGSSSAMTSGSAPAVYLLPQSTAYQSEAVSVGDATFWFIGDALSGTSTSASGGNGSNVPTYGLVDEASKLNLNTASATMLENLPNMTTSLAQAIVAWRTSGTSSSGSSTSSTSASTTSSGSAKGGPFESIYELAQVAQADGDDPSILYGNDTNLNHVLDNSESQGSSQFTPGIFEYVTVFSREPNMVPGTSLARISVTTQKVAASTSSSSTSSSGTSAPTTLTALLTQMLGQNRGEEIMISLGLAGGGGGGGRGSPGVTGTGRTGAAAAATGPNSVLEFYIRGKLTQPELNELTPYLTSGTTTGTYKKGLINVNTASAAVLQCVPGITQQVASQIVSARQTQGQTTPSTDLAWLVPVFGDNTQGHAAAYQAGPYLTTETFQVTADVAAVGANGLGYRRTLFVIDGSNGAPQIVYRHDMTSLGWALGPNALQSIGSGSMKATTP